MFLNHLHKSIDSEAFTIFCLEVASYSKKLATSSVKIDFFGKDYTLNFRPVFIFYVDYPDQLALAETEFRLKIIGELNPVQILEKRLCKKSDSERQEIIKNFLLANSISSKDALRIFFIQNDFEKLNKKLFSKNEDDIISFVQPNQFSIIEFLDQSQFSSIWNNFRQKDIFLDHLNLDCIKTNEMFGNVDESSKEWQKGFLENILQNQKLENSQRIIFIKFKNFDNSSFKILIQSLSNFGGELILSNGQQLRLDPDVKLVFYYFKNGNHENYYENSFFHQIIYYGIQSDAKKFFITRTNEIFEQNKNDNICKIFIGLIEEIFEHGFAELLDTEGKSFYVFLLNYLLN